MNTSLDGLTIDAPNASYVDDSRRHVLSRVCAAVLADGFQIQGVYEDTDAKGRVGRMFEIDVTEGAGPDAEDEPVIGSIVIVEKTVVQERKIRGVGVPVRELIDATTVGFNGPQGERLARRFGASGF